MAFLPLAVAPVHRVWQCAPNVLFVLSTHLLYLRLMCVGAGSFRESRGPTHDVSTQPRRHPSIAWICLTTCSTMHCIPFPRTSVSNRLRVSNSCHSIFSIVWCLHSAHWATTATSSSSWATFLKAAASMSSCLWSSRSFFEWSHYWKCIQVLLQLTTSVVVVVWPSYTLNACFRRW